MNIRQFREKYISYTAFVMEAHEEKVQICPRRISSRGISTHRTHRDLFLCKKRLCDLFELICYNILESQLMVPTWKNIASISTRRQISLPYRPGLIQQVRLMLRQSGNSETCGLLQKYIAIMDNGCSLRPVSLVCELLIELEASHNGRWRVYPVQWTCLACITHHPRVCLIDSIIWMRHGRYKVDRYCSASFHEVSAPMRKSDPPCHILTKERMRLSMLSSS